MQPSKITILGDFFDCQIYRGRLYLWTLSGDIYTYDWNGIIDSLETDPIDKIPLTFYFKDGRYLYKSSLIELFKDSEFRDLLKKKFQRIQSRKYILRINELNKFLIGKQQTPTGIIPIDSEIYNNYLYFITENGLFKSSAHRINEKYPISSRPKKIWDCRLLSIKANKYPQIALSGGSEGLFELNLSNSISHKMKSVEEKLPIFQISKLHSSFANYSYLSIYNTSLANESFMALFNWKTYKGKTSHKNKYEREYDSIYSEKDIFCNNNSKEKNISWGVEDKIYLIRNNNFDIIHFNNYPQKDKGENYFTRLKTYTFNPFKGNVIGGTTTYFGNIIECENALIVIQSDNDSFTIEEPITRWRVYPRSKNYENHLHVILDDRIEIYSFCHDYFINQNEKEIGIQFSNDNYMTSRANFSYFELY